MNATNGNQEVDQSISYNGFQEADSQDELQSRVNVFDEEADIEGIRRFSHHFLTHNSTVLPKWFKNYIILHREQRLALNETNWKNQRYLFLRCLDFDDACGGASGRPVSSIIAMLCLAERTRMLFIKWSRPALL